jgi:O-antigen ligase
MDIFGSENIAGHYVIRIIPWGLILLLDDKIKFKNEYLKNILIVFFLILPIYLCFISGDRTPFFLSIINFLIAIIFFSINKIIKLFTIIFTVLIVSLMLFFSNDMYNRVIKSTISSFDFSNDQFIFFSHDHDSHYRSSFKMIKENFPLGIGPKLFREECRKEIYKINDKACSTHPHNYFIQLVLEIGIFGIIFIFSSYGYLLYKFCKNYFSYKKNITKDKVFMYYTPLIVILFPFVPTHQFYSNWWSVPIYLSLGLLFSKLGRFKII